MTDATDPTLPAHPEGLLAGYVEGLDDAERALVDDHLTRCETCRKEIALASAARTSLATLPEVPVPLGVTRPVMEQVEGLRPPALRSASRARLAWAGGLAAAAALVAVVAVAGLFDIGADGGSPTAAGGKAERATTGAADAALASPHVPLEQHDIDYDAAEVERLALSVARGERLSATEAEPEAADEARRSDAAIECLLRASAVTDRDVLVRLIEARFEGRPAYLGAFLESAIPGDPPDKVVVWIVARDGCEVISFAQQRI